MNQSHILQIVTRRGIWCSMIVLLKYWSIFFWICFFCKTFLSWVESLIINFVQLRISFLFSYNIHQLPMQKGFICSRIWNESKIYKVAYDRKISRRIVGWINIVVSLTWSLYYVRNSSSFYLVSYLHYLLCFVTLLGYY